MEVKKTNNSKKLLLIKIKVTIQKKHNMKIIRINNQIYRTLKQKIFYKQKIMLKNLKKKEMKMNMMKMILIQLFLKKYNNN